MSYPPPQGQVPPPGGYYGQPPASQNGLANQMASMSLQCGPPRAGDSPLLSMFAQGNVLVFQSQASNKTLRIRDGIVEGTGGRGELAQFTIHVRRPGVVALQNVKNPDNWLAIYDGTVNGTGRGGPYCEFLVGEVEGKYISLESTMYPGQHLGILPDGTMKPPANTGTGQHGRYTPTVISYASHPSPPMTHAPPPSVGYPQLPPQAPPQAQPTGGYPPPQGSPQTQHTSYPPPQGPPQGQQYPAATYGQPPPGSYGVPPPVAYPAPPPGGAPPPVGPQIPLGFNVLDAFQAGNVVQLVSRSSGYPVGVKQGSFTTKGTQFGAKDINILVDVPAGAAPGIILLHSATWPGMYMGVDKSGNFKIGKGGKWCHLKPMVQPDNYVAFMSVENHGHFISFRSNGAIGSPKNTSVHDQDAQFFIRVEKQVNQLSQTIMTAFGRPSVANNLRDAAVIQLYLKENSNYLSINKNGHTQFTKNSNDAHTFFRLTDRGMGIYTLNSYKYPGFRLKMQNYVLSGKGFADMSSDFRLKENADGTVLFESVVCSGSFVGIQGVAGLKTDLNLFLVTIQKFGGSESITKTAIN